MVPVLLPLSVKSNARKFSLQTSTSGSSWPVTVNLVSTSGWSLWSSSSSPRLGRACYGVCKLFLFDALSKFSRPLGNRLKKEELCFTCFNLFSFLLPLWSAVPHYLGLPWSRALDVERSAPCSYISFKGNVPSSIYFYIRCTQTLRLSWLDYRCFFLCWF